MYSLHLMFSVVCFFNKRRGKSHSQTFLEEASYFPLVSRSRTSCLLCHYLNAFSSNKLLLSVCLRPSFSYLDIGEATCCTSSLEGIPCGIWLCLQSAPSRREVVLLFSILIFFMLFSSTTDSPLLPNSSMRCCSLVHQRRSAAEGKRMKRRGL